METDRVRDISLSALKQRDPYISGIVDVASQVALYSYNTASNEWEKTEVEGTLFVYARSASPHNGFTIMNRLSMDNLIQPITKDLDFKLQDPFLLYRIAELSIHGIWFYDKNDCLRIANLMTELAHKSSGKGAEGREACGEKSVNILEMLNRAREVYQQTRPGQETNAAGTPGTTEVVAVAPMTSLAHQQATNPPEDSCNRRLSVAALLGTCAQTDGGCNAAPCDSVSQGTKSSSKLAVARALSYDQASPSQRTAAEERHGFQQVAPQAHLPFADTSAHQQQQHPEGRCQLPAQVHQCLPYVVECNKDRGDKEQVLQKMHGNRIPAKQGAAMPICQTCPDFGSPAMPRQMPPDTGAAMGQVWHNVRLPNAPAMQPGSCFVPQAGGPDFQGAPHLRSALQPGDLHVALKSGQTLGTAPQGNGFQPVAGLAHSNAEPPLFDLLQKLQIVKPEPQHHQQHHQQHQQQHQQQSGQTSCSETQQGPIVTLLSQEDFKKVPKNDRENLALPFPHITGTMAAGVLLSPQTFQQSSVKLVSANTSVAQSMPPQMAHETSHGIVSRSHLQETLIHLLKVFTARFMMVALRSCSFGIASHVGSIIGLDASNVGGETSRGREGERFTQLSRKHSSEEQPSNDNEFLNIIYEAFLESSSKASLKL